MQDQLYAIGQHQADKDFRIAEFYQRTGHPGSAYLYYELVRRRYPGTRYAERATKAMAELRTQLEKSQSKERTPPANEADVTRQPLQAPTHGSPLRAPEPSSIPRMLPPTFTDQR